MTAGHLRVEVRNATGAWETQSDPVLLSPGSTSIDIMLTNPGHRPVEFEAAVRRDLPLRHWTPIERDLKNLGTWRVTGGGGRLVVPRGRSLEPGGTAQIRLVRPEGASVLGIRSRRSRRPWTLHCVAVDASALQPSRKHDAGEVVGALLYAFAIFGWGELTIDNAFSDGSVMAPAWPAAVGGLGVALAILVGYVGFTGYWRRWLFWRSPPASTSLPDETAILVMVTATFTALTSYLTSLAYAAGWVGANPSPATEELMFSSLRWVGHELVASVPVLKIPETFGLEPPVAFSGLVAALTITVFRVLLVVPVVRTAKAMYQSAKLTRAPIPDPLMMLDPLDPSGPEQP